MTNKPTITKEPQQSRIMH